MKRVLFFLFISILVGCNQDEKDCPLEPFSIPLKGERLIGLDLLDVTERGTFDDNLATARDLGINYLALHLSWSSIETSPESYTDPGDALFLLNQVSVANNFQFSLTISPIDLTGKTVPSDLNNTRFNDTLMINRFKRLLDFVFTKMPTTTLLNLQIGNEIDGYDTNNEPASFWSDYGVFLQEMTAYVHSINPNVRVGFTGTLYGMSVHANVFRTLQNNVDILGVTYYPIESNFDVKAPSVVDTEITTFLTNVAAKPVYFQEIGYQTSATNNSSTAQQAAFFSNFFATWDQHMDQIKTANIVRLNDISLTTAQDLASPFGIADNTFVEYLRTLGLRTNEGSGNDKEALGRIRQLLIERGW